MLGIWRIEVRDSEGALIATEGTFFEKRARRLAKALLEIYIADVHVLVYYFAKLRSDYQRGVTIHYKGERNAGKI